MKKANSSFVQRALPQQLCSTSAAVGATRELDKCNDGEEEGGRGQAGDPERCRAARRLRRHLRLRAAAASETLDLRAPTRAARSQMTGLAVGAVDTVMEAAAAGKANAGGGPSAFRASLKKGELPGSEDLAVASWSIADVGAGVGIRCQVRRRVGGKREVHPSSRFALTCRPSPRPTIASSSCAR